MSNGLKLRELMPFLFGNSAKALHESHAAPLRAELFSADQMEQHGRTLASAHVVGPGGGRDLLLSRLTQNEAVLLATCDLLTTAIKAGSPITPAGEWLLDNFYLIEEQVRAARRHLPKAYSSELPRLASGPSARLPRVYDIALEAISHGDGRVDTESLVRFITAYQTVTPLNLGELWAIPIMLRLALIENLRRVGARIANAGIGRNLADSWADRMTSIVERDPKSLVLVIADMARSDPPMTSGFVAELARRLQGQSPALAFPLTWVEQRLAESSQTLEQLVQADGQQQAADQVSISNSIASMRLLAVTDWREFVEVVSIAERTLGGDPGGVYLRMDFTTRDRCRHVIEKIARHSSRSELEVAEAAVRLAQTAASAGPANAHESHVGFYLIGNGLPRLESTVLMRRKLGDQASRYARSHAAWLYFGPITALTVLLAAGLWSFARAQGAHDWLLALCAVLAVLGASQLAVELVNWLATLAATPGWLPRMDYRAGVPAQARTLVVVPTMLASAESIDAMVEALEVRFLANRDPHLHFGLLTDFVDAGEATLPSDDALLDRAVRHIEGLNEKYAAGGEDVFFLLHRPRRYNAGERAWIGFERKRGKLADLNALLRGAPGDRFSRIVGRTGVLRTVKYVITLDADTQLPRDAARELIGAMMHPLNRPRYDDAKRRVVDGYGILQPRVAGSLTGASQSRYAQLQGNTAGIDPYTRAVSDVYQDLFGEGSFIGKGIYDVDAFEQALADRFPDNRILSHDLLEGCYARSALLSDTPLYEDDPSSYLVDMRRRRRWIRGDWQIASWLLRRVPGSDGRRERNPLSFLSQWKILDNLRRSLVTPALTLLMVLGWTMLSPAAFWTLAVLGMMAIPALSSSLLQLLSRPPDSLWSQHVRASLSSAALRLLQTLFAVACLPFEAYVNLDAIVRTTLRTMVTRRRLLQWTPSSDTAAAARGGLSGAYRAMWIAPVFAIAVIVAILALQPQALPVAAPIVALWLASPLLAWWSSRPLGRTSVRLEPRQVVFLRMLALRTWSFFDHVVGSDDNWLPPDNVQENPGPVVAHRTSPTNMGLSLLANLCAHDFGYVSTRELIARTAGAFATMQRMERYRGHFFNWYDTRTLEPLPPRYVSTVDSSNLAGHLLTLQPGLRGLADQRIFRASWLDAFADRLAALRVAAVDAAMPRLDRLVKALEIEAAAPPASLVAARGCLHRLAVRVAEDADGSHLEPDSEALACAVALQRQCREAIDEFDLLAPWSALPAPPDRFAWAASLAGIPTLREIAARTRDLLPIVEHASTSEASAAEREYLASLATSLTKAATSAAGRLAEIEALASQVDDLSGQEYEFLYDESRHLLTIGYKVDEQRRDPGYYDLLASEARLCSFVGIAQGRLPQESWFGLGRLLTHAAGEPILLSWSGSMFEYLMPLLVMPTFPNTLLDQTAHAAVKRQIQYGNQRGVPWGISECGYNTLDAALNYQYRAFGVPGLGLQRGLAEDLVIAPYASALALMIKPREACNNLQRLAAAGCLARFGLYEAVDYTPARLRRGETSAIVRSHMAHHQGMTLLSLAHLLLDRPMQARFVSVAQFQSALLLLQERVPKDRALYSNNPDLLDMRALPEAAEPPVRVFKTADTPAPAVQLLSNGRYHVMVTNSGGGYSRWRDLAVTRWREDTTCDDWGTFCYLRDAASGKVWSPALAPAGVPSPAFEASFTESRVDFRRRDDDFETHTEIVVSPEDDIELRRMRITNLASRARTFDIVSYAEVVLASAASDALHPAFSNLFVQTEVIEARQAILCTRRARGHGESVPSLVHLMTVHGGAVERASYETDRARFIGRGNSVADPQALRGDAALSGSQGSVLDPIVAIRQRITLAPKQTVTVDLVTGIGEDRAACHSLIEKYQDRRLADRAFEMAWTHSQVVLRQLNITEADAQLYGRLTSSILYANATLRADPGIIAGNRRSQSGLWGYAISGDLPIVLLQIKSPDNIGLVRQLVQAHAYWRLKGLKVDLVIWNEEHGGYRQVLHDQIMGLVAAGIEANVIDRPGGIFVRAADQISVEDRNLLQSVARAIFSDSRGSLADQMRRRVPVEPAIPRLAAADGRVQPSAARVTVGRPDLVMDNGLGGFSADGREYVIVSAEGAVTPAPWANVVSNPHFGCLISDSGPVYTWHENAHEFRLTPWHNDPVTDAAGEAFYVRDEVTGRFWSPSPLPRRGEGSYTCRHGFGYSVFEHVEDGIVSELTLYVALDAPVKYSVLKIRNASGRARRLSATGYVEWVLGDLRPKTAMQVVTEIDPASGAAFARNAYHPEFADRVAFFDVDDPARTISGDRTEFIGRNGSLRNPAALARARLSGRVGAGLDPCMAIQVPFELADGQSRAIVFRLGVGRGPEDASRLALDQRRSGTARAALEVVKAHWQRTLGTVQVETPDPAVDLLVNGWLLYQTIACRLWGRTGYYQSGGAYGFRDQLQDTMALVHADPGLLREQLLRCASRQFLQGDVQHWWHPPLGRGVRSHCSDDLLWLPLATCRYIGSTGDTGVLSEMVHFLDGRPLSPEEESYYDLPARSHERASLYEHCVRAVQRGLAFGAHGLPLIGSGDWNDGMNNVGAQGRGESVWLGFFLFEVLTQFGALADRHGDASFAQRCRDESEQLRRNLELHGWDGGWYRRAYFDDGTPLGSAQNAECQIDSIAQSWSVLSGAGAPERSRTAMGAVDRRLVKREHALVQLLDPPFDNLGADPGYIRGYVPGVRENGGQYTHAAIWAAMAFAGLGDAERAWELLAMINPVNHGNSPAAIAAYRVEPYVVAADVYAVAPHTGRGGWTWYTGSAGWMYRLIVESLLGMRREGQKLTFAPRIPASWPSYRIHYRYGETLYRIRIGQTRAADTGMSVLVDGVAQIDRSVPLVDDRHHHEVEVEMRHEVGQGRDTSQAR